MPGPWASHARYIKQCGAVLADVDVSCATRKLPGTNRDWEVSVGCKEAPQSSAELAGMYILHYLYVQSNKYTQLYRN